MFRIDVAGKFYDAFVREPVSFWTGKEPKEVKALDVLPVYAGAALWPLALLGIAGCDEQGVDGEDAGGTGECSYGDSQYSYSGSAETQNIGICSDKVESCSNGVWQATVDEVLPQDEDYTNGFDDDCDGYTDECPGGEVPYQAEVFNNGIDDDCDGFVDEIDLDGPEMSQVVTDCSFQPAFVRLLNGATLTIDCPNVVIETDEIEIDAQSKLEVVSQSCASGSACSGTGDEDGGGGEGAPHIGAGGIGGNGGYTGVGGACGSPYGSVEDFIAEPGMCGGFGGGPYGAAGGVTGGALTLVAGTANIMGTISVDGGDGATAPYDDGGGGGGSAGTALIYAGILNVSLATTRITANGGDGGCGGYEYASGGGGGGGGGGSIEIKFNEASIQSVATYYPEAFAEFVGQLDDFGCLMISGGFGGCNGANGQPGAVNTSIP